MVHAHLNPDAIRKMTLPAVLSVYKYLYEEVAFKTEGGLLNYSSSQEPTQQVSKPSSKKYSTVNDIRDFVNIFSN